MIHGGPIIDAVGLAGRQAMEIAVPTNLALHANSKAGTYQW